MGSSVLRGRADAPRPQVSGRPPLALASPEDVFLAWLVALPEDADIAAAARAQIARIDRVVPASAPLRRLRALFEEAAANPR